MPQSPKTGKSVPLAAFKNEALPSPGLVTADEFILHEYVRSLKVICGGYHCHIH